MKLMEAVPDAVENIKGLVREMKNIPKKDSKRMELSYKASVDTLKSAGIIPSQVQSQILINIFQKNDFTLSPVVREMLEKHNKSLNWDDEIKHNAL